jgi:hypothetical protein
MTKETFHAVVKHIVAGDHIRVQYKAMPFGPGPHGLAPNLVGGTYAGTVGDAVTYDDISGDGQTLRAYVDCEDILTLIVLGAVVVTRPRLM